MAVRAKRFKKENDKLTEEDLTKIPLCVACSKRDLITIKLLLENEPNCITSVDSQGRTALHIACLYRYKEIVQFLIQKNASVNSRDDNYETPLHLACKSGSPTIVNKLLSQNCKLNMKALKGYTPLHIASMNGHIQVVELLLKNQAEVNAVDEMNYTPLMLACIKGYTEIAKILVQYGSAVNRIPERSSALHFAVKSEQKELVEFLISKKAYVNQKDWGGITPLMVACLGYRADIVEILIKAGSLVNHQNIFGTTALHAACKMGDLTIIKLLLMENTELHAENYKGLTILKTVLLCKHVSNRKLELFMNYGINISSKDRYNSTALHSVSFNTKSRHKINLLLNYGADINTADIDGKIPLHYVKRYNENCLQYFKQHIIKLHVAGFPVHEINLRAIDSEDVEFIEFRCQCERDVQLMKESKLSDYVTYYDILKARESKTFIIYAENSSIVHQLETSRYKTKFSCYRNLLKVKIEKILHVNKLLQYADYMLSQLFNLTLPREVNLLIRDYFSLREMQTLYDRHVLC